MTFRSVFLDNTLRSYSSTLELSKSGSLEQCENDRKNILNLTLVGLEMISVTSRKKMAITLAVSYHPYTEGPPLIQPECYPASPELLGGQEEVFV